MPSGSLVQLAIVTADAAGNGWRSNGEYRVGTDGALQFEDPDRPWWDMAFNDSSTLPVAFTAPATSLRYQLTSKVGGESATATVTRQWGRDVVTEDLRGDGWRLRVFRPATGSAPRAGVVIVPGSTGSAATAPTAALLASHGHTAAVLAYMQEPGLPATFAQIPVEAISHGIRAFAGLDDVDSQRVTVLAQSVGTAAALAALTRPDAPAVRSIIVVAPTHVVWQALGSGGRPPKVSSLTLGGKELNYVPIRAERLLAQTLKKNLLARISETRRSAATVLLPAFQAGLKATSAVTNATIPVERIDASMLIIAGELDAMWPSTQMARALAERRGGRLDDVLMILAGAGHVLRAPATPTTVDRDESLVSGGTPAGIAQGQRIAWEAILKRIAG